MDKYECCIQVSSTTESFAEESLIYNMDLSLQSLTLLSTDRLRNHLTFEVRSEFLIIMQTRGSNCTNFEILRWN